MEAEKTLAELAGVEKSQLNRLVDDYVTTDMPFQEYEDRLETLCDMGFDPVYEPRGKQILYTVRNMVESEQHSGMSVRDFEVKMSTVDFREMLQEIPMAARGPAIDNPDSFSLYGVKIQVSHTHSGDPVIVERKDE